MTLLPLLLPFVCLGVVEEVDDDEECLDDDEGVVSVLDDTCLGMVDWSLAPCTADLTDAGLD